MSPQDARAKAKQDRLKATIQGMRDSLTPLVDQAAGYRKNIADAKTSVKVAYYKKKLKKVQQQVISLLTTINSYETIAARNEQAVEDIVNDQ